MKKIGNIEISFKNYIDGIYYYKVSIKIGNQVKVITLPRYDTFLGWIEVFGLPPQNEWVVLNEMDDFSKHATLTVNDTQINESVRYVSDKNTHTIETIRKSAEIEEKSVWTQNYEGAPELIKSEILFNHNDGKYKSEWTTSILANKEDLMDEEVTFIREVELKHGKPDIVIKKIFKSSGTPPPIYYSMFPIQDELNLSQTQGSVIELGYLKKDSPHKIDNVHGDWYKRFDFGNNQLFINESNYSSCVQETENGAERIKDTYRKELFTA